MSCFACNLPELCVRLASKACSPTLVHGNCCVQGSHLNFLKCEVAGQIHECSSPSNLSNNEWMLFIDYWMDGYNHSMRRVYMYMQHLLHDDTPA